MKRVTCLLCLALLVTGCIGPFSPTTVSDEKTLPPPRFSHEAGFYSEGFELSLLPPVDYPDARIYYTLDGSVPDPDNVMTDEQWEAADRTTRVRTFRYREPIGIAAHLDRVNDISLIPTNYYNWEEPAASVPKSVIVTAKAWQEDGKSRPVFNTFFDHDHGQLPVVSLGTERTGLFSHRNGILVPGVHYDEDQDRWWRTGNYQQRGREWERITSFELFRDGHQRVLHQNVGIRIHGRASRGMPLKSFRLYARSDYGTSRINHQIFPTKYVDDFNRILLRNSGQDSQHTLLKDGAIQRMLHDFGFESQHYQPAVVYLNGEYWGILNFRDRFDHHYLETHYGAGRENTVILQSHGSLILDHGEDVRNDFMTEVNAVLDGHRSAAWIRNFLDVSGYLDYNIVQFYIANSDWPHNNTRFWRFTGTPTTAFGPRDGRWRWMLFDLDSGFRVSDRNMFTHVFEDRGHHWTARLLASILAMPEFQADFAQRTAVYLATRFSPESMVPQIQGAADLIQPEIARHAKRWNSPCEVSWQEQIDVMMDFATDRPAIMRQHLQEYFNEITGTAMVEITGIEPDSDIRLHTVRLHPDTPGVVIQDGSWSGELFTGVPLTLESGSTDLSDAQILGDEGGYQLMEQRVNFLRLRITEPDAEIRISL
ncbi:CotH kinase family protein [Spirochaeta africana]|uniref:CotH protein n=1 Tax=Spirochaeta africana (strain ATCC 700263 / DSM 8902 / Z-7692) TaxID=889378 RepID=H9UF42_SPIAZ|nr:CotH kinase family protein [Spirochaeta africana]AFG36135.1 CotH protein [Spirochaeta africana DSM 8902]